MRVPRIFTSQILSASNQLDLDEAQSHYVSKVLRMQAGRELVLFNGTGGEYAATIVNTGKKTVTVDVGEFISVDRESPLQLELAIGVSRGERMDWVLQKATELGATKISPLFTERTEVKLNGERLQKKLHHWQQIIISACEQCQRNIVPVLNEPIMIDTWLASAEAELKCVLHHRDNKGLPTDAAIKSVALLIGPEGGLSETEISQAIEHGFAPLTLGPRVLRTETAPVAAISLVQYLWGDL